MFVLLSIITLDTYGQRNCGSEMNLDEIQQNDFLRYQRIINLENLTNQYLVNRALSNTTDQKIIIPVVVHIVYNNSTQNISDAQILSQIEVLNQDFRRENSDKVNTPSAFSGVAGSFDVEFKLAIIDPLGNATNGITRTATTKTGFSQSANDVKFSSTQGENAWNTQKYLNIWVCNFTSTTLMGYAQFPSDLTTNPNIDGVVISYKYFGTMGTATSPYNGALRLLRDMEFLQLIHVKMPVVKAQTKALKLSDKFAGALHLSDEQYENFQTTLKAGRSEWERNIC